MNGKMLGDETCQNVKQIAGKYGVQIVCDEADEKEIEKRTADVVLPGGEMCDNAKEVASKVGVVVVCDEEV